MKTLASLLRNNRGWATRMVDADPSFFSQLTRQQEPDFLWIGCSDSRVPANQIVGLLPGELFVHRNVGNLVTPTDLNCLSVLQYAVEMLGIRDIILCGHYGCGGVKTVLENTSHGLIDNWLSPLRAVAHRRAEELRTCEDLDARVNRLCEWNVIEQVMNVGRTTVLQEAWRRGQEVFIHGWIYAISDGLLQDLDACISSNEELEQLEKREDTRVARHHGNHANRHSSAS